MVTWKSFAHFKWNDPTTNMFWVRTGDKNKTQIVPWLLSVSTNFLTYHGPQSCTLTFVHLPQSSDT